MQEWLNRTELLVGKQGIRRLGEARVAVLGLGGVGGAAAEALCRAGVGNLLLVDHDTVDETNLNRQIFATRSVLGRKKCAAAAARLRDINPSATIDARDLFYSAATRQALFDFAPDYIVDAIDTVTSKLDLVLAAQEQGVPLICSMGTGNRFDPTAFRIGDIADTAGCGCALARVFRRELRRRGVARQTVLYSTEPPVKGVVSPDSPAGRHSPGSVSFVPPAAGYAIASYVVRQLLFSGGPEGTGREAGPCSM